MNNEFIWNEAIFDGRSRNEIDRLNRAMENGELGAHEPYSLCMYTADEDEIVEHAGTTADSFLVNCKS